MNKIVFYFVVLLAILISKTYCDPVPNTVGFQIGQVKGYKLLKTSRQSKLYQIQCSQVKDGRPMKLIELVGTHYQIGYDYGALLAQQMVDTYNIFMASAFSNPIELFILELFLDWQYQNFLNINIPTQFKQQIRGIQQGGSKIHKIHNLRVIVERVLVVSAYPGDFSDDIMYAMLDLFLQKYLRITNPKLLDYVENNLFKLMRKYKRFMNDRRVQCSFMAVWGSKTQGGNLYTMRNLDWNANSGINKYKIIFVWKVKDTIPHTTIGFPSLIGALTGMSQAGLTVHEAGLDSMKQTELGLQWSLRLRYVLMHAHNLGEAKTIWNQTINTFGINHMVASAADIVTGNPPIFVVQTMRGYTAWFVDNDKRQKDINFTDPQTKKSFKAGFAMKDAVFRTNHGYDPMINSYRTKLPSQNDSTFKRYTVIKDSLNNYLGEKIGQLQALNVTANVAHKGGSNLYKCPQKDDGTNVISVMFVPGQQKMYAAIEYGSGSSYKTACCGVYLHIELDHWFSARSFEALSQKGLIKSVVMDK